MARWPLRTAYFWEEAPFFRLLLPLCGAILCYDRFAPLAPRNLSLLLILCFVAGLVPVFFRLPRQGWLNTLHALVLLAVVFLLGLYLCSIGDPRNDRRWMGHYLPQATQYWLRVQEQPQERERTWKLPVQVWAVAEPGHIRPCRGKALLYVYKSRQPMPYRAGDTLLLRAAWQPIGAPGGPFAFDLRTYYSRNHIFFQAFVPADSVLLLARGSAADGNWIMQRRQAAMSILETCFPKEPYQGLMKALLLGETADFDPELRQAYADTGVIHIVAISGSHVATLFLMVTALLFWIRNKKYTWVRYLPGLAMVWLYVLMAGAPPSAMRSAVMFSFVALGVLTGRQQQSLNTLLASAFILLLGQPMWLFSVGFQLSFLAVLALILLYPAISRLWKPPGYVLKQLWSCIAASLAVELLVAPLVVYYFHNFPLLFLPANIVAWLLMGIAAMGGGFLVLLFSALPPVAHFIAAIVVLCIGWFNGCMRWLQHFNPQALQYLVLSLLQLLLLYTGIVSWLLLWLRRKKEAVWTGFAAFLLLLTSLCRDEWKALHQRRIIVYSIRRQTVAELIDGKTHTYLSNDTAFRQYPALRDARTGWHAWRTTNNKLRDLYHIGGKSILIWHEGTTTATPFPVDVLIVDRPLDALSVTRTIHLFHPREIIAGNYRQNRTREIWTDSCQALQTTLYLPAQQGACLLE